MAGNSLQNAVQGMSVQTHALADGTGNIARQRVNGSRADSTLFIDNVRGVSARTITQIEGQGPLQASNSETDLAIDGNGFFVVERAGVTGFKRTGQFFTDKNGKLVDYEGNTLKGWPTNSDGSIDTSKVTNQFQISQLQDIFVNKVVTIAAATKKVQVGANLPATEPPSNPYLVPPVVTKRSTPVEIFDSLGNAHTMNLEWEKISSVQWNLTITAVGAANVYQSGGTIPYANIPVIFDGNGFPKSFGGTDTVTTTGSGTSTVATHTVTGGAATPPAIDIVWAASTSAPKDSTISLGLGDVGKSNGITQIGNQYSASRPEADGVPFGSFSGVTVNDLGQVIANFNNGNATIVAQLALANFASVNSLARHTGNLLRQTEDSGQPVLYVPKTGGIGAIAARNLEGSLVDTATELTNMVQAQNAFNQNVQSFKVSSDTLQTLNSIIR